MVGTCELCHKADTRVVLDHNHSTGMVRGYLCLRCNRSLVSLWEDVGWRARAIKHLERETGIPYVTAPKATIGPRTRRKPFVPPRLPSPPVVSIEAKSTWEPVTDFDRFIEGRYLAIAKGSGSLFTFLL